MSANLPRAIAPRSGARRACAPPMVAARSASVTLRPKYETASAMTSGIEVIPFPPGVWSEPSAIATPLSSSARTGGGRPVSIAVLGHTTATTPARARAPTSSSSAPYSRWAAEFRREPGSAVASLAARVQPGQQAGGPAGAEHPACLSLGEAAVVAVDVHAVGAGGRRIGAPGADRVDVVVTAAEVLGRHRVGGQERHMHARHARLAFKRAQQPHIGKLAVPGQVVTGLRLDGRGAGHQPGAEALPDAVAERPGIGPPGDGDRGRHPAAGGGDLRR